MTFTSDSPVEYIHHQISAEDPQAALRFQTDVQGFSHDPAAQQVILLNRYWRRQLAALPENTIDAREALLDGITVMEWTRLFVRHVLPLVIRYHLPVA